MKKKFIATVLALSSFSTVCFAELTANTENLNGVVKVEGKTTPNTTLTLTVKSIDDDTGLYTIKETVSDKEGDYSFNFKLRKRQTVQDEYKYVLSIKGDGEYSENITVFHNNVINSLAADIKSGMLQDVLDDSNKTELAKCFGLDIEGYNELNALDFGDEVIVAFNVDASGDNLSNDDIANIFNMEVTLFKSKLADNSEFLELLGDDFTQRKLSSFTTKRLYETKDYNNIKEYEEQILMFETLNKVNSAKFSQLEEMFRINEKILTLDTITEYDTYTNWNSTSDKKRNANESIVSSLLNNPAQTTADFITVFKIAVNNANKIQPQVGNGNSSSAPGGKGSTSNNTSFILPDMTDVVLPGKQKIFNDVEIGFWAEENIRTLTEAKIINGYEDNTFRPNNSITREEFVTILVKAFNLDKSDAICEFEDVGKEKWFYPYVASAFESKIINGISLNYFGTGRKITRQDVAVMVERVINIPNAVIDENFVDDANIADYAKEAVYSLKKVGVINGKTGNAFAPQDECTRAECATIIKKAMDLK